MALNRNKKKQTQKTSVSAKNANPFPHEQASIDLSFQSEEKKFSFSQYDRAFMLRKLHKNCHIETVIAQFMPKQYEIPREIEQLFEDRIKYDHPRHNKWHAVYNNDRQYFTPAFVIGRDLKDYLEGPGYELQKFQEKLNQTLLKLEEPKKGDHILKAKPGGKKCQVCKKQFEDYADHIKQKQHLQLVKKSKASRYINQFISEYSKRASLAANAEEQAPNRFCKVVDQNENEKQLGKTKRIGKIKRRQGNNSTTNSASNAVSQLFSILI